MDKALAHARAHREDAVRDLQRLVRQPSISTQGVGLDACAELTLELIGSAGLSAEAYRAPGAPPTLVGRADGGPRTLLFYNHYDVQPADPVDAWTHDPFGATVSDGRLWGRGAGDMKGAVVGRLWAIRAWIEGEGGLPVGVRFLVEGEEETGSEHLDAFIAGRADLLRADACVWESGGITAGRAEIVCGCKGVLVVELTCREGRADLHSASAAALESAPWRLVHALATLRDDSAGTCTLDGYLDPVRPPSDADRAMCERLASPERLEAGLRAAGRDRFHRSLATGLDAALAAAFHPTCNIQGIASGYAGRGMKNVLPCEARAKLDFRLVADQRSGEVLDQLRRHLDRRGYGDFEIEVLARVEPSRSSVDDPLVHAMERAATATFGLEPLVSPSMGGFGPMATVTRHLGIATIQGGEYHRPGNAIHAPDEHIWLDDFFSGIEATIRLLQTYSAM